MSQKSATVAENGETTATVAEFGDSRTFLRQCGQALRRQQKISIFEDSSLKHCWPLSIPKGASLRESGSVVIAVGDDKNRKRRRKESYKFTCDVFVGKPSWNK